MQPQPQTKKKTKKKQRRQQQQQQRRLFLSSSSLVVVLMIQAAISNVIVVPAVAAVDDDNFVGCIDRELTYPEVIDMDELAAANEVLEVDFRWVNINPGFGDQHGYKNDPSEMVCGSTVFRTRALGGSVPGPTLTVSPGTTMKILFKNELTYQPGSYSSRFIVDHQPGKEKGANNVVEPLLPQDGGGLEVPSSSSSSSSQRDSVETDGYGVTKTIDLQRLNRYNDPDVANLHFHGLHISSVLPSDDATLEVLPQEEFEYTITIPEDHEPGLHWIHPHHHGSSTLQRVGGAAMAIVVKDPPEEGGGSNPPPPSSLRQRRTLQDQAAATAQGVDLDDDANGNDNDVDKAEAATDGDATADLSGPPSRSDMLLPPEVRAAPNRIMIFQEWDITEALLVARMAGDKLLEESFQTIAGGESIGRRFVTVNGKYQPIATIEAGVWERWRFLYAGWQDLPLRFAFTAEGNGADCEFYLLAKDGIYIADYPRGPMITEGGTGLPVPPGGRADFMVRCNTVGGTSRFEALSRRNTLMVNVVEPENDNDNDGDEDVPAADNTVAAGTAEDAAAVVVVVANNGTTTVDANNTGSSFSSSPPPLPAIQRSALPLTPWKKPADKLPNYLRDTFLSAPTKGCNCETSFEGYDDSSRVNGRIHRAGNNYMHTSYLGAVVERDLKGMNEHSYHQHVYPYQLIEFAYREENQSVYAADGNASRAYFKVGDWHDTYLDKNQNGGRIVTVRYAVTDFSGKMMVHCHNTLHSDRGVMSKEYIRSGLDGSDYCECDIFGPIDGPGIVDEVDEPLIVGGLDAAYSSATAVSATAASSAALAATAAVLLFFPA